MLHSYCMSPWGAIAQSSIPSPSIISSFDRFYQLSCHCKSLFFRKCKFELNISYSTFVILNFQRNRLKLFPLIFRAPVNYLHSKGTEKEAVVVRFSRFWTTINDSSVQRSGNPAHGAAIPPISLLWYWRRRVRMQKFDPMEDLQFTY